MQVKVFEADDMAAALKLVKESLGPDALILSTKTVRKGGLGLLGKPRLEVTAAVEGATAMTEPAEAATAAKAAAAAVRTAYGSRKFESAEPELNYEDLWRKRKVIDPLEEEVQELKGQLAGIDVESLRREIGELKDLVRHFSGSGGGKPATSEAEKGSALLRMINELIGRGVEAEVAEVIVQRALTQHPPKGKVNAGAFLAQSIGRAARCTGPFAAATGEKRRIALIGPTGVGKTTTVAKLAADHLLRRGPSVALVTLDIYRIAAAEQLKVYGEIMNLPVDVASTPEEFRQVLHRHRDKELVLIDTAGRSPRDRSGLEALAEFLGPESGVENNLVLAANTRDRDNRKALERFGCLPLKSLIFTKLDECEALGPLLNIHLRNGTPLSYLTDGQRVPEDLLLATPELLGQLVLGTGKDEVEHGNGN